MFSKTRENTRVRKRFHQLFEAILRFRAKKSYTSTMIGKVSPLRTISIRVNLMKVQNRFYAIACLILLASSSGCIRKRMTIRSNPPGAMVYIDKQQVGLTPASTSFVYYGTRNVEIVRDGYRTEKFFRKVGPPWYAIPPFDFVAETLWPFELRDQRVIDVQLTPDADVPKEALIASGEQLRLQASQGVAVNPPPTIGQPAPIFNPLPPQATIGTPILGPFVPQQ
jgi:hypothetical protein